MYKLLECTLGCIRCCGCGGGHSSIGRAHTDELPAVEEKKYPTVEDPETFYDSLQTGDVLLVSQTSDFGALTQTFDKSPWDHCAMILRCTAEGAAAQAAKEEGPATKVNFRKGKAPTDPPKMVWSAPAAGQLQVAEATGTGSHNFPLEDWLVARGEKSRYIAVRTLRDKSGKPLDAAAMAKMETFANEVWGRKYQANALELVKAIVKDDPGDAFVNKDDETLETLFCAEHTAECYQKAGMLTEKTLNSSEVLPSMFDVGEVVDRLMASCGHGYSLQAPVLLKAPGSAVTRRIHEKRKALWPGL